MLGDHPTYVVLLATNLEMAKDFYQTKVGLRLLDDNPMR
jgi:catechol 2,3-dioxygenase-like lactoylglutathione lyase family enzyme